MANNPNKIKYNLKNVHVAKLTVNPDGTYTYGTPKAIPGAVSLTLDAEGDNTPFWADGIVYYRTISNNGYTGSLEMALIPDWFRKEFLQEILDSNGVLVESANLTDQVYFALLFEFDGDVRKIRHVMFKCTASRPSVSSQTKEATITPVTETLNLTADARADGLVKAKTGADTSDSVYENWYLSVYSPSGSSGEDSGDDSGDSGDSSADDSGSSEQETYAKLSALSIGTLTLTPSFDPDVTSYTATTSNATNTVTATGADDAEVAITVNEDEHTSGNSATWSAGENTVTVVASKSGLTSRTYTVTVTKTE